jgi:hypothetical protein
MGKEHLHVLIDRLPEAELVAAARYLEFLAGRDEPPLDPEILSRIDADRCEINGEWIPQEVILREFGI